MGCFDHLGDFEVKEKPGMNINEVFRALDSVLNTALPGLAGVTFEIENGFLFVYQRLEPYIVRRPKGWDKPRRVRPMRPRAPGDTWMDGGESEGEEIEMVDVTLQRIRMAVKFCADQEALTKANVHAKAEREKLKAWDRDRLKRGPHGHGDYVEAY